MHFYKTYTDEKQIENSNIQLNIKIITLLVLKENAFKVDVNSNITIPIDADVNVTEKMTLDDYHAKTTDTRKLQ